jgi:hypothetical protein
MIDDIHISEKRTQQERTENTIITMTSTMTLSAVRTVVGRQWLSRSSSSVFTSGSGGGYGVQHHVSLLALGLITSTVTSSSSSTSTLTLCEDGGGEKKGFLGRFFGSKKEEAEEAAKKTAESSNNSTIGGIDLGNIDFSNALEKLQSNQFWDQVAATAGGKMQGAVDSGIPTQLSYGFVSGYCSGMAFKKIGRLAAGVFGT